MLRKTFVWTLIYAALLFCIAGSSKALVPGKPMLWGCNAHMGSDPYGSTPASTVFSQMKAMGMTYCRVDLSVDGNGNLINSGAQFDDYVAQAPNYGIKLLPMLYIAYDLSQSWQTEYNLGYNQAYNFVRLHGQNVDAIELGNEMDNDGKLCTGGGTDDGQSVSSYNAANMHILAGYLTGMCNGAHAAKPGIRCAIDCINHPHYGWFQIFQNEGVPWDITAPHWYSSSGSITNTLGGKNGLAQFSRFGKPLWITEVNAGGGSYNGDTNNINGMAGMINDMFPYPTVEAIISYELYDETYWKNQSPPNSEGFYGLYANPTTPKPIVSSMTQWIAGRTAVGHRIGLYSTANFNYVSCMLTNSDILQANAASISNTEKFDVYDCTNGNIGLLSVASGAYVSDRLNVNNTMEAIQHGAGAWEWLQWKPESNGHINLFSPASSYYVSNRLSNSNTLQALAATASTWEDFMWIDQGWYPLIPNGTYTLTPQNATGSRLDDNGGLIANGNKIQIWQANNSTSQKWIFTNTGGNQYKIASAINPNYVLDVNGGFSADGTLIQLYQDNGSTAQRWIPIQVSGGYTFTPACALGSVMDLYTGGSANGTQAHIWTALSGHQSQTWTLGAN